MAEQLISVKLKESLYDKLSDEAAMRGCFIQRVVEEAVTEYLEKIRKQKKEK
jgi:hypothetical protein